MEEDRNIDVRPIDEDAVEIYQKLKEFENRRGIIAKEHKILICGDYGSNKPVLELIRNNLKKEGYIAFLAEDLKGDLKLPDYEHTKMLMNEFHIIILVDGDRIGTGIDSGMIISNGHLQIKTIFLTRKSFNEIINLSNPYIYFPIYESYQTEEELLYKAVGLAMKEANRLAKLYIDGATG